MSPGSIAAAEKANRLGDNSVTQSGQVCHPFAAVMRKARGWWANKTAYEIAARTGHSIRTVRRWMAGDTTPDADVAFDLMRSDRGPAVIEIIAAELSPTKRAAFWREIARVAERQLLQEEREKIERKIEANEAQSWAR